LLNRHINKLELIIVIRIIAMLNYIVNKLELNLTVVNSVS
jgi:hypothetical protein